MGERPEIECRDCNGNGWRPRRWSFNSRVQLTEETCEHCHGYGWRLATDDEWNDLSEDAYSDMCEGEPPLSVDERRQLA